MKLFLKVGNYGNLYSICIKIEISVMGKWVFKVNWMWGVLAQPYKPTGANSKCIKVIKMQEAGNEYAGATYSSRTSVACARDAGTWTLIKNKGSTPTISHKVNCLKCHVFNLLIKIRKCIHLQHSLICLLHPFYNIRNI